MIKSVSRKSLAAIAWLVLAGAAGAVETGTAQGVRPDAFAVGEGVKETLVVGSNVQIGEIVETGKKGQVELLFGEGTKLVVGPASSLVLEDYLLRGGNSAGKFTVNALAGTFRFVTGNMSKQSYQITTPTGTIGVRGTEFDFAVDPQGRVTLVLYEGSVEMCSSGGQCSVISADNGCAIGATTTADRPFREQDLEPRGFASRFPYLVSQSALSEPFRLAAVPACATSLQVTTRSIGQPVQVSPN